MTSNIGSQSILDEKLSDDAKEDAVMKQLRAHFRPEFLNRVDDTIVFKSLSIELLASIVDIQLESLRKRLEEKKIKIDFTDKAKKWLGQRGFDPLYGARPLKRVIKSEVLNRIAKNIISGEFAPGDHITVDAKDDLIFKK